MTPHRPADLVALGPDVLFLPVEDGSARLLDMGGSFHALSRSGAEMLRGAMTSGVATTAAALSSRYGVEADRVARDLDALLARLRRDGLIGRGAAPARRRRRGVARLAARLLLPLAAGGGTMPLLVLARAFVALFGWADTVAAFAGVLRRARGADRVEGRGVAIDTVDAAVRTTAAGLPGLDCKERALAAWCLLHRGRLAATLVVGVQLYPLAGHCWCEVDDRTVSDAPSRCAAFDPVIRYDIGATGLEVTLPGAGALAPPR